ncbi:MAG: F0F1 ATP synthase subunit delta [Lawsonibacter sp.]|nr:F0F1 ATP synthase subunit delta [Lawsonibacter sp.]
MRNILKGFLEPKADSYILPSADDLTFEEGIKDFALPSLDEEEPVPEEPAATPEEELSITVGDEASESVLQEPEPVQEEKPKEPETPVHYAQLQAELILNQAREEARQLLDQARTQAIAEQEEIRAGARDEGYREGYAQGTAKAMDDAIRDREATAARLEKDVQAFLEKASLAREEMILQSQDELVELCLAVAEKVVRVSLKSSSEVIVKMIQTATERMKRQEWVHIYISGCDARQLAKISPALTGTLGALSQHIKVVPMGDDEGGTCIVETPEEIVDASVSTQMSHIRDVLHDQMGSQWIP